MYDILDLKKRKLIIKRADLDDIHILDENYVHLIRETLDSVEKEKLITLRFFIKRRIKQLKEND